MNNAKKLKIHFNYKNKIISIDCNYNEKLSDILSKLNDININSVHCIYSNKIIENKEFTISQIINNNDSIINEIEIQIIDIENNQIYNKIMDSSLNSSQDQKNIIDSLRSEIKPHMLQNRDKPVTEMSVFDRDLSGHGAVSDVISAVIFHVHYHVTAF